MKRILQHLWLFLRTSMFIIITFSFSNLKSQNRLDILKNKDEEPIPDWKHNHPKKDTTSLDSVNYTKNKIHFYFGGARQSLLYFKRFLQGILC